MEIISYNENNVGEDHLLPAKPCSPSPSDCCGSGCTPCVYDIYEEDLKKWEKMCKNICVTKHDFRERNGISRDRYTPFELIKIEPVTSDTSIYTFKATEKTNVVIHVGQHIIVKGLYNNQVISRPYTPISNEDTESTFNLLIKKYDKGKMSSVANEWKVGDFVDMRGPYGSFTYKRNTFPNIVMLAAGTGIAPMYRVIKHILSDEDDYTKISLLYSSRTFDDILLREELYSLQSYWNFKVCHYLNRQNNLNGKKYSENVVLQKIYKRDVEEFLKGCIDKTLILISGTKSYDKDMVNVVRDLPVQSEHIIRF